MDWMNSPWYTSIMQFNLKWLAESFDQILTEGVLHPVTAFVSAL